MSLTFFCAICVFLSASGKQIAVASQDSAGSLPELGDAASTYLNSREESIIGRQFLRQLLASEEYIDDPYLHHYLNDLGARVAQSADLNGLPLQFYLLEKNELNAFAVPGGHITFHSGLLLTTETESELASVIGHEIAHLSQRHLPRMIAKAEATKLPTTAAIIAAILVGGQAGVAGVTLANANLLSNQLAYSRDFEKEADAIGITMMSNSGFDPEATATFFAKLQRFNLFTSKDVPEFLRSHPLSYTRVAEAESRLAGLPEQRHQSSFDYLLARARIRALYSGRAEDVSSILEDQAESSTGLSADAARYGLALVKTRQRDFVSAGELLRELDQTHPDTTALQLALADLDLQSGKEEQSLARLRQLADTNPGQHYISLYLIDAYLDQQRYAEAKKATRYQLRRHPEDYRLFRKLSKANVGLDLLAEAHQADAEYLAAMGKYKSAISALELALRENDEQNSYLKQSVEARITQLKRLEKETEKAEKNS